ncbi:hypothetical protein AB0I60_36955 [Actinosynnema sp. NPDC050436]|uniref:hypothetical protein n=1 Tax=Actinosynnema sp. NPDC050436 TaxID=3155659 RepID=UPI0033C61208
MSTSPRRDPDEGWREPSEDAAPLLGTTLSAARRVAREAVGRHASLPYVGYVSKGVFRFSFDRLGEEFDGRVALQQLGRRVAQFAEELDGQLQEPDTGPLIRTVVHTERGEVVCNFVIPREYVVVVAETAPAAVAGPLTDDDAVAAVDEELAKLTTDLRTLISLPSLNHGGWETAHATRPLSSVNHVEDPCVAEFAPVPEDVRAGLAATVRPKDVHYLAYHADGEVVAEADHLGHASLDRFYTKVEVEDRRAFYREFGWQLESIVRKFNRMLSGAAAGGLVTRLVLDVERGAVYYYQLDPGEYLVGVTLDQSRVRDADERIARLAHRLARGRGVSPGPVTPRAPRPGGPAR